MDITKRIASILPKKFKDAIEPWYRWLLKGNPDKPEKSSGIAIDSFGGFEIAYRIGTVDRRVINKSFDNDIYFSGVPEYHPGEDDVIIDVGAHIGTFSILASSRVKRGKVYAIEASQDSFNILKINVALNQCSNVSTHHLALANKEGRITLYHEKGNWGNSTVKRLSISSETVEACTLSSFMEKNEIKKCHFMKLNCEGGEFPILLSTPNNVLRKFSTLLILYHCDLWDNNTEDNLIHHLESCGFNCVIRNQDGKRGWIIAENIESF